MNGLELLPPAIHKRLESLPTPIRELFTFDTIGVVIRNATRMFGLEEEQAEALKLEVELILCLFETRDDLGERIANNLKVEEERATAIKQYLDENLFITVEAFLDFADDQWLESEIESLKNRATETPTVMPPIEAEATVETPLANPEPQPLVKPLRTFADDIGFSRAHGYGAFRSGESVKKDDQDEVHRSNQDDIIKQWDSKYRNLSKLRIRSSVP